MLHVTIIILVCFTVSAPSEGIAVTRRKSYLFKGFCLFEEKVPKATEISSSSIDNVDEEQFLDCVKHKITYRLSFFNNFFINQYQNRKNNYCSIMNSALNTKKKDSSSSAELTYRKRNLLWTRKGLESIKTLQPTAKSPSTATTTTTPKPLDYHTLNYIEKKRFFAIKKIKTQKRKRVRRYTHKRHSVGKSKNLRKQITFSGPGHQISEVIWDDDYFEEKPRGSSQAFPRFHYLEKFIRFKKNCRNPGSVLKQILQGQELAAGKATHISSNVPEFRHSRNYVSNKHKKNARLFHAKNFNKENRLLSSDLNGMDDFLPLHRNDMFIKGHKNKKFRRRLGRFQNQVKSLPLRRNCISNFNHLIRDPRFKANDEINTENNNELSLPNDMVGSNEGIEEARHSNKQEKVDYNTELDRSEYYQDTKSAFPYYGTDETHFKTKQEMSDFLREILKASADYSADLNEGFNSVEEPSEFCAPESTITKKPFLSRKDKIKKDKEISSEDFDFPDYDEIYDPAADCFLKNYTPLHFRDKRKFKYWKNVSPKKKYWKSHLSQRSDSSCQTPLNFKRSLLFKKLERKKKFCGSRCSKSCGIPNKCWKSAPLLCIPYIRKSQDDLLKYLIRVMQNMLGKPYPQKLDIFENTKYKPSVKKCPQTTCEDIMPHDPEDEDDDDDDDDDNCDTKNPCKPCPSSPAPRPPSACSPVPTSCSSCSKGCTKNSNEASCPSFPCSLPNLNQIYTEPAACASDKCYSTLPPFLLPLSSIIQSGSKKDLSKKPDFDSASVKPTASTVKSLASISNKNAKVLNDSESLTFFPPKKFSPEYFKKAKEVSSDSLADDNQLHSDQRLNEKILPEFVDYQEEMNLLNLTDNMSESTLKPSTGDEPFLFDLPKFFGDEKHAPDLSNSNINNSFTRRDLNVVHEYGDEVFRSKNPANISPKAGRQIIHRIPSKQKHINGKNYYKLLPASEDNTYQSFPMVLPQAYDEPQIDKPLYLRRRNRKYFKFKNRKSLKRQKRQYDYDVDDSVNYDDYLYDTNDKDEDHEERSHQQLKKKANSNVNELVDDYGWTPMQFEMFNELAKLVTGMETKDMSSLEPVSDTTKPSTTDSAVQLSSSTGNQLETTSIKLISGKSSTSVSPKEVFTMKTTFSAGTQEYDTTSESKPTRGVDETRSSIKSSSTTEIQVVNSEKEGKSVELLDVNTTEDTTEDGQILTTVGSAFIVKGPKKQMTKPSPKMYTRVYPDSVPIENGKNETAMLASTDSGSTRNISLRTTTAMTSVTPDVRLQLLAVCEGYLEVMKLIKSQNQTFAGDLDSDLSSYCENIISQSLSQQTELPKSKKQELNSPAKTGNETPQNTPKKVANLIPESQLGSSSRLVYGVLKRELDDKKIEAEELIDTNAGENGNTESPPWKDKQNVRKKKRRKKEYQHENQKIPEADDEFLKKGMTEEQVELLRLLKKRKKALLNWLFNSKEDQVQPEVEETEYFDDNDESNGNYLNLGNSSGTVRPRGAKSSGKTNKAADVITNDSVIPVYAKEYGYDKGGQLKQVEVLWRKVNDQTNEKQTYKNLSVLALVLTSTVAPNILKKNNFFDINGYVNEDVSDIRIKKENKVSSAAEELKEYNNSSDVEKAQEDIKTTPYSNSTVTFIRKPNPSSIIGTEIVNTTNTTNHPNITQNIAGKLNKAKGVIEEYTIEFWNYAVYILPIMLSILFLFCCVCCAIHILRTNKKSKKKKKKKKQFESTDEEASTEETYSEPKKKRRDKSKKSKNIWKVWKKNANDEANLPEKNKSFLKFLKSRKNDKAGEGSSVPYSELPEPSTKADNLSEAAERRELIALLEELKKIEMEQVGEKKEQKSVEVQYMIQDHEEPVFKRPEMLKEHPFYSKNCRFHEPVAEEFGIYRDGELNELLPCECGFYSKKRDYLRNYGFREKQEDRCEKLFNLFRNAGVCHHQSEKKKKFTDKDRNFILGRYRNADINDEKKEAGFTVKVCDMSEFKLSNPNDWVGEMEHFNNQVTKKKHVRLKDDGVLCRL